MPKRRLILILLGAALLVLTAVLLPRGKSEPVYRGRPLSKWLMMLSREATPAEQQEATAFIREYGTNVIPLLVEYSWYTPSLIGSIPALLYHGLGKCFGHTWYVPDERQERGTYAMEALAILGPAAEAAIPDLTRMMNDPRDPDRASRAALILSHLGKEALPPLLAVLTNHHSSVRQFVAMGMFSLGSNARPVLPVLIQCLNDTNPSVAWGAAYSLGKLKLDPDLVVPPLAAALQDSRTHVRNRAALALAEFPDQAAPAIPVLRNLLSHPNPDMREAATNALRKIAPEALTNAPPR